jgi:hypothetical protein
MEIGGSMVVEKVISLDPAKEEEVIESAAIASNETTQDPISLTIPRRQQTSVGLKSLSVTSGITDAVRVNKVRVRKPNP